MLRFTWFAPLPIYITATSTCVTEASAFGVKAIATYSGRELCANVEFGPAISQPLESLKESVFVPKSL